MTLTEINKILDRVTFKPNYRCSVLHDGTSASFRFTFVMRVPDVKEPSKIIPIHTTRIFPEHIVREEIDVLHFIKRGYKDLEEHEFLEWFKVDGMPETAPHLLDEEY